MSVEYQETIDALLTLRARVRAATLAGVEHCAEEVVKPAIQDNLQRLYYPPASPPGDPPAYRTGHLHDEVYTSASETETGAVGEAWPSTPYARIHELSGWAGRDHASFLPKRPYVGPALENSAEPIGIEMASAWRQALGG